MTTKKRKKHKCPQFICDRAHVDELKVWEMDSVVYHYCGGKIYIDTGVIWDNLRKAGVVKLAERFMAAAVRCFRQEIDKKN